MIACFEDIDNYNGFKIQLDTIPDDTISVNTEEEKEEISELKV